MEYQSYQRPRRITKTRKCFCCNTYHREKPAAEFVFSNPPSPTLEIENPPSPRPEIEDDLETLRENAARKYAFAFSKCLFLDRVELQLQRGCYDELEGLKVEFCLYKKVFERFTVEDALDFVQKSYLVEREIWQELKDQFGDSVYKGAELDLPTGNEVYFVELIE